MIVGSLTFHEAARSLWPALRLLAASTKLRPQTAVRDVHAWLGSVRAYDDRRAPLKPPPSPYSTKEVLDWLHAIWRDLNRPDSGDAHARRREIVHAITSQHNAESERVALLSAVDYLHRLAGAIRAAEASDGLGPVEIPAVRHEGMQSAYRKLVGLAAADLPVWFEGERGTEMEWAAGLVQRVRDGVDETPVIWSSDVDSEADLMELSAQLERTSSGSGPGALLVVDAHRASPRIHEALHRLLTEGLSTNAAFRMMITTEPIDLAGEDLPESSLELFSFLEPMRVTFVPLRNRTADIPALAEFFRPAGRRPGPIARCANETLDALMNYHWPGNISELQEVTGLLERMRPSGAIRPVDLPKRFRPLSPEEETMLGILEGVRVSERFRMLGERSSRLAAAGFLLEHTKTPFTPLDFQRRFGLSKETVRRILLSLKNRGVVEGLTGARGVRITRYRTVIPKR